MRIAALTLLFAGCGGDGAADGGTDGDTGVGDTDDGGGPDAEPEKECDDEIDDDDDGAVDCDDSDCAAVELCTWPAAIDFETQIEFEASRLAQLAGYDDCTVNVTASLSRNRAESCPGCDRVYSGDFQFGSDDCPEEFERPTDGGYGVTFQSETQWEVFGRIEGEWTSLGVAEDDGTGTLRISDTQPVEVEGIDAGELTTRFAFTPR